MGNTGSLAINPATVQAWSAVAVAVLTAALIGVTIAYVRVTDRMAGAMKDANEIQSRNLDRILRAEAPSLRFSGVNRIVQRGEVTGQMTLENVGTSPAYDVVVVSDWGNAVYPLMREADRSTVAFTIPDTEWTPGSDPVLERTEFLDRNGNAWTQRASGPPEPL
jgi:hypothetical protein